MISNKKKYVLMFLSLLCFSKEIASQAPLERQETEFQLGAQIVTRKGKWNILNVLEFVKAHEDRQLVLQTQIAYGLTERLGANMFIPIYLQNKSDGSTSRGISDIIASLGYIFFDEKEHTALVRAGIQAPTGSTKKEPTTGIGTFAAALEFSAFHTSEWYFGFDVDAFLTIPRKGRNPGNNYAAELRFGRTFNLNKEETSTLTVNIDMDAFYARPDKLFGIVDPDSGGTLILLGPLFSWSYNDILVEFQVHWPIAQNLFGDQARTDYEAFIALNVTF